MLYWARSGGDTASELGASFTQEFRAWVVLPERRQFWRAAERDILSVLRFPPLRAVRPACPPPQAA
jgi:hypothetical protein